MTKRKKQADVSADDFIDNTQYAGADFFSEYAVPFWDALDSDSERDENGDPVGWWKGESTFAPTIWNRLTLGSYELPGMWRLSGSMSIDMDVQKPQGFDGAALITRGYVPALITMEGTLWTPEQWAVYQNVFPAIWTRTNKISGQDVQLGKKGQVKVAQSVTYEQQVKALQQAGFPLAKAKEQVTANLELQKQAATGSTSTPGKQQESSALIVGKQRALSIGHPAAAQVGIASVVISRVYLPEPGPIVGTMLVKFDARQYVDAPAIVPSAQKVIKGTQTQQRGPNAYQKAGALKTEKDPSVSPSAKPPTGSEPMPTP